MSDAPERIWLLDWRIHGGSALWASGDEYPVDSGQDDYDVEYIRADLARLPSGPETWAADELESIRAGSIDLDRGGRGMIDKTQMVFKMSDPTLKPCPFCGAPGLWQSPWSVGCYPCDVTAPAETWNHRADLARLPEEIVERLRVAVEYDLQEQFNGDLVKRLLEDVLAWHERAGDQGEAQG